MQRKPTFFERLTGSINIEDEGDVGLSGEQTTPIADQGTAVEGDAQLTVDVYQLVDSIVVQAMVAGVKPEDLDISITREMVTIRGRRVDVRNVKESDFFFRELYWGTFSRTILLPAEVEPEESEASEKHGLLTIRLPKIDKGKTQKLKVRGGQ